LKILIIDDEPYVPFDPKDVSGPEFCSSKDNSKVPDEVHFKTKYKSYKKYLVWLTLDEFGNSSVAYISEGTMTGDEYLKGCLKKRLLPFI
jgi:hypothetical protein